MSKGEGKVFNRTLSLLQVILLCVTAFIAWQAHLSQERALAAEERVRSLLAEQEEERIHQQISRVECNVAGDLPSVRNLSPRDHAICLGQLTHGHEHRLKEDRLAQRILQGIHRAWARQFLPDQTQNRQTDPAARRTIRKNKNPR